MYKIMTAGPTQVRENVRLERSKEFTNPDIDPKFFDFYKETCELLSKAMHTDINLVALKIAHLAEIGHQLRRMEYRSSFLK